MAYVPQARASALPGGHRSVLPPSPWRRLATLATERGEETAFLVSTADGFRGRSWAEVEQTVERAAAGLIRSGLRADQVVLSLVPFADVHPELDIALRAIGSVVIHVSEHASEEDIARELAHVDVRLVISRDDRELTRLAGLRFRAAEMLDLGNDSWDRLLALGAERLVMDPDVVNRVDRVVDPGGTVARVLLPELPLGRVPEAADLDTRLPGAGVTLLVGPHADAFVLSVRDAHLAAGGTVVHLADPTQLAEVLQQVQPTVLALAPGAAHELPRLMSTVSVPDRVGCAPPGHGRRPSSRSARGSAATFSWSSPPSIFRPRCRTRSPVSASRWSGRCPRTCSRPTSPSRRWS